MILGREEILRFIKNGWIKIEPFREDLVRENGVDLRIGSEYAVLKSNITVPEVDLCKTDPSEIFEIVHSNDYIVIPPRGFVLVCSFEYLKLPDNVVGLCNLRSTFARWGLSVPPTVIDAGFEGVLTIEIFNNTNYPVRVPVGVPFLHVVFVRCVGAVPYMGTYRRARGVVLPKRLCHD